MSGQHTPGPWKLCYDGQIDGADGTCVLNLTGRFESYKEFNSQTDIEKANQRLIAAAPELLAAAKRALNVLLAMGETPNPKNALGALDAAIKKATGAA